MAQMIKKQIIKKKSRPANEVKNKIKKSSYKYTKKMLRSYFYRKVNYLRPKKLQQINKIEKDKLKKTINREDFFCCICLQLMLNPILLKCGHPFCLDCIQKINKYNMNRQCPLCRKQNSYELYEKDHILSKIIKYLQTQSSCQEQLQRYKNRSQNLQNQQNRGLKFKKKKNDQIELKINNDWQKRNILQILETKVGRFYKINFKYSYQTILIPQNSLNLREIQREPIVEQPQDNNSVINLFQTDQLGEIESVSYLVPMNQQSIDHISNNVFSASVRQILQIENRRDRIQNIIIQSVPRRRHQIIIIQE